MTKALDIIPPSGFTDGRPWLDHDPPTWEFPASTLTLAAGEVPVKIEGRNEPIGRVTAIEEDERGLRYTMEIEPRIAEQLTMQVGGGAGGVSIQ